MNRWLILVPFVVGIGVGVAGTLLGPRFASPYLPEAVRGKAELVEGIVARKQQEPDRLLLTVVAQPGAILATFRKKIAEINLLVEEGDTVTLALSGYQPFVEDPRIQRVRKQKPEGPADAGKTETPAPGDQPDKESPPR
ncbi:MAG: hypothetical protein ACM362_12685 [Candidatus Methylomirabilota bacterium]